MCLSVDMKCKKAWFLGGMHNARCLIISQCKGVMDLGGVDVDSASPSTSRLHYLLCNQLQGNSI